MYKTFFFQFILITDLSSDRMVRSIFSQMMMMMRVDTSHVFINHIWEYLHVEIVI